MAVELYNTANSTVLPAFLINKLNSSSFFYFFFMFCIWLRRFMTTRIYQKGKKISFFEIGLLERTSNVMFLVVKKNFSTSSLSNHIIKIGMMFLWFKKTCATNVEIILRIREIKLDIKRFTITNIEEMILGVDYASAGTGIIFSSSSELGQHIEQVIDTGQEFILNNGDDATTLMSSNSVFYISLESNNCVYFYEGCCGLCEYKGWIICNSPEMACHKELVLFVIGDSSVDCRTNNFLGTFARVDRLSYGHDFDIHQPTGRFCNGRIPVDYLASHLGFIFVPSYLGQAGSIEEMILGVNNASSGAEIIFSSGSELGQHISLSQQIEQVTDTIQEFCNGRIPVDYLGLSVSRLGLPFVPSYLGQAGSTEEMILGVNYASAGAGIIFLSGSELGQHISLAQQIGDDATIYLICSSVFCISIGSNDYIQHYLLNVSNVQSVYLPWSFNQFLARTIKQEIKNLYNAKVRKVVVMGLAPIGCAPNYLGLYSSKNGECVVTINGMILEFSFAGRDMDSELNEELVDANIIFSDAFEDSMDIIQNHDRYALRLGSPFVPSYLGQAGSIEEMILGVNYSSAGAGIIFSSGSELGQHISLAQQIGDDATSNLISSSVFYISIGSNVYIQYYLLNVSNDQSVYLPWSFNQFLAQTIKQEIKNLYNAKVRKVVVMGLAPIGWAPDYLGIYSSKNGECLVTINDMILEFNFAVRYMVSELNEVLVDASIIFCDAFEGSMDIIQNHDRYGFNVTDEACCGLGEYKGWIMCVSPEMACNNASSHIWWDQFHPTSAVNRILADNVWSSLHTPSGTQ